MAGSADLYELTLTNRLMNSKEFVLTLEISISVIAKTIFFKILRVFKGTNNAIIQVLHSQKSKISSIQNTPYRKEDL